ncbi:MAG: hypothetical protein J0M05_15075, partial [Candidatus Kapabacteria bacterium]|nr:hypothetical protein [Candidatus Kapabacteria bacterium]
SDLADHGVRKYDYITGRFMAVDPLWEKYRGLNTYQYAANNPMIMIDRNGKVIFKAEGTNPEKMNTLTNRIIPFLRSLESSTINAIIDKAESSTTKAFIHIAEYGDELKSGVGYQKLTSDWEKASKIGAAGITKASNGQGDIVLESNAFDGITDTDDGDINMYAPSLMAVIDELNHLSSDAGKIEEHRALREALLKEIEGGNECLAPLKGLIEELGKHDMKDKK